MNFNTKDQKSDLIDKSDAISVGESVYQQLRENLLDNRYKPGSRLYSEELKEVYSEDAQVMSVQPGYNVDKGAGGHH